MLIQKHRGEGAVDQQPWTKARLYNATFEAFPSACGNGNRITELPKVTGEPS